jgi:endonuclease-3 related protein
MHIAAGAERLGFSALYEQLAAAYGPQDWWPAEDAFEVMVGAVLVQRTTWTNAARALDQLRKLALLDPRSLAAAEPEVVSGLIRSAGFFRMKARRVRGLAAFVRDSGGVSALGEWPTARLRAALLDLEGVGPETADSMLLYAFERPVAVIDEYLRRLVRRLRAPSSHMPDDDLRESIVAEIDDVPRLNELHALIVEHGKRHCRSRPRCGECLLRLRCSVGAGA